MKALVQSLCFKRNLHKEEKQNTLERNNLKISLPKQKLAHFIHEILEIKHRQQIIHIYAKNHSTKTHTGFSPQHNYTRDMLFYHPYYVIGGVFVLATLLTFALLIHVYFWKRLIFIRKNRSKSGKTLEDTLVFGKSYDGIFEIPHKRFKCCCYTVILLPSKIPTTLNVLICRCKTVEFIIDTEIVNTSVTDITDGLVLIEGLDYISFPIFRETNNCPKTRGHKRTHSYKTYSSKCAICLEEFAKKEKILLLNCKHGFHKDCIVKSFCTVPACPCCQDHSGVKVIEIKNKTQLIIPALGSSYGSIT